jgi:hypothetical protein
LSGNLGVFPLRLPLVRILAVDPVFAVLPLFLLFPSLAFFTLLATIAHETLLRSLLKKGTDRSVHAGD